MGCSTSTARFTVEVDLRYICIRSRTNLVWLNSAGYSGMESCQCQPSETTLFGIVWFGTRRDRRLDSGRAAATARRVFDAHTILRESSAATMSFPASNEPIADRDSIHKSCRTLEAVVNVLNDYCEAANAIVTLQRKLVKALRDAAAVKYVPDIPCT